MRDDNVRKGILVPGLPHPLLCPEKNEGWQRVRDAYEKARLEIEETDAEILIVYSTFWPSILGHQIQAFPEPEWTFVDENDKFDEGRQNQRNDRVDARFY
jgi:hypothetical protein